MTSSLAELLSRYQPRGDIEARDVEQVARLARSEPDPWLRTTPLHATASALIVHPDTRRVLLRWHERQRDWLQVGGHADAGEQDALAIALREAREETGLVDLAPWPDQGILHVVIVPVRAGGGEPAHEHADLRFVLTSATPDAAAPESPDAALRWLDVADALRGASQPNLAESLERLQQLFAG